jgi:hypothetical protein
LQIYFGRVEVFYLIFYGILKVSDLGF